MADAKRTPPNAGKGRPKGSQNKITSSAKEAYRLAFEEIGGPEALAGWARENQTEFYKLHARLIPAEIEHTGKDGDPIEVEAKMTLAVNQLTDEQLRAIASIRAPTD